MGELVFVNANFFRSYYKAWSNSDKLFSEDIDAYPADFWILECLTKSRTIPYKSIPNLEFNMEDLYNGSAGNFNEIDRWIRSNNIGRIIAFTSLVDEKKEYPDETWVKDTVEKTVVSKSWLTGKEKQRKVFIEKPVKKTITKTRIHRYRILKLFFETEEAALLFKMTWG